jgi:hypothetical protein
MGSAAASRALSGESGKWKLENRKWNGSWIFKVVKVEKKEFVAEGAEYTEDAERREEKSKKQEEKKKGEARKTNKRREGKKCAMRERIARALRGPRKRSFLFVGGKVSLGKNI